ncbi:MAG: efflux RND transporter periplasmic adaptor subunit, partial [Chromatiales bacterium]|nr:efflux RND transporter periplasmic adaptor subunit [Chromatiales bacterium]
MKHLLLVFTVILLSACKADPEPNHFQASPAIRVQTQTIEATTQQGEIKVFGVVESAQKIDLNVEFSAPIEKVLVDEGQTVRRQQPLLILDTGKLALTLKQTQQVLAQARIQKENAALRFRRLKTLKSSDTVSQQQYDEAGFALDEAAARIRELNAQLQIIERDLESRILRSPLDAVVDRRHVEAGQSITAYEPLITLQATESYKVSVYVGEHHLPYLQVGNHGRIETVAGTFESKIHSISAGSDAQTGNYEIKL